MSYGLMWVDSYGKEVNEKMKPLILLGSVSLTKSHISRDISVTFNCGGLTPYWVPVIKTEKGAMGSLMLEKAELVLNGHQATYTFRVTQTNFGDPGNAEIKIFYGVL